MIPEDGRKKRSETLSREDGSRQKSTKKSQAKSMVEIVNKLTEIIKEEAEIIDEMFLLLLQHVSTEDDAMKEIIDKIENVAELKEVCADPLEDEGLPF